MTTLHTCNKGQTQHGTEEDFQDEVAIVVHQVAGHDRHHSQTQVLDGLHAVVLGVGESAHKLTHSLTGPIHCVQRLYLIHFQLAHYENLNNFRQEQDMVRSTTLIEAAKSLAPSNIKGHGKILYQKPWLKVYGA